MTVYVQAKPSGPGWHHLWADTPDEALLAAFGCGADMEAARPYRSALHYEITGDQFAAAVGAGAQLVLTPYEAVEAAARWNNNRALLDGCAAWRLDDQVNGA